MTQAELDKKISDINHESIPTEEKTARINRLKEFYGNYQIKVADEAKSRQQTAEADLKSRMRISYLANPVATNEDFERDYPQLKSDYLRNEAMKTDAQARESQARMMRSF
jgi:hypothetical protein